MILSREQKKIIKSKFDIIGPIRTWQRFAKEVRLSGKPLLADADRYKNSIFVAGCQRSGTTAVSRLLTNGEGLGNFWKRRDEELDAAVILSGKEKLDVTARYCFQTTYLNEQYREYIDNVDHHQLVWILRNPYSVVYSLVYNWEAFAFSELYDSCGEQWRIKHAAEIEPERNTDMVFKACCSYNSKIEQLRYLLLSLPEERLIVLDYDELVESKELILPKLYRFLGLTYLPLYAEQIHSRSVDKSQKLSDQERQLVQKMCVQEYESMACHVLQS